MADRISLSAPRGRSIELLDVDRGVKYRDDEPSDEAHVVIHATIESNEKIDMLGNLLRLDGVVYAVLMMGTSSVSSCQIMSGRA